MRVVLASRNNGKLLELQRLLEPLHLDLESQAQHNVPSPEETGLTFIENALIKARAVSLATDLPAIADDSGLVVPALNGAPGIYSARYAGTDATDSANNLKLTETLRGIKNRAAYFYCAMVFVYRAEDPTPLIATARWHGSIIDEPRGDNGFGYDPYFLISGMHHTSAQLASKQKNKLSHRGQATQKLIEQLANNVR
ncbi:MAG: RdgB/HAM1 family non-canonical purine NTP pyrophosphatase [Gammaproteobacteria bacterium]|nr:RdgB/HAM1 family non-canonical purine NTP pyrophosphatase [Gammaproteobacteria bacterium]